MHIYLSTKGRTVDAGLNGSFRSGWLNDELDLGKQGWGEIKYAVKISYQFSVELASIQKSSGDWYDDAPAGDNPPRSKNPPWEAIERAINRIINSSDFKSRVLEEIGEKLG